LHTDSCDSPADIQTTTLALEKPDNHRDNSLSFFVLDTGLLHLAEHSTAEAKEDRQEDRQAMVIS
jgi:hypothetical protein